jgi:hypothetical protein
MNSSGFDVIPCGFAVADLSGSLYVGYSTDQTCWRIECNGFVYHDVSRYRPEFLKNPPNPWRDEAARAREALFKCERELFNTLRDLRERKHRIHVLEGANEFLGKEKERLRSELRASEIALASANTDKAFLRDNPCPALKVEISALRAEVSKLAKKCDRQAKHLAALEAEKPSKHPAPFPDLEEAVRHYFPSTLSGAGARHSVKVFLAELLRGVS